MILSSVNFKGGQGKSLWAVILADWLGPQTEILDCDPKQGDSRDWAMKAKRQSRLVWPRDLESVLREAATSPEWFVVDCPPHEGEETRLALELSAMTFLPVVPAGAQDARAWGRIAEAIQDARAKNRGLKAAAILNAARQTTLSHEFLAMLEQWHAPKKGCAVLGIVPQRVALSEAFGAGLVPKDPSITAVLGKLKHFAEI